ncbi:carnitine dehydratase [Steroidobacter denitrificans]|uniref:Carnitine dehydratase n=1 Tax=Steroidobacter denitrificans TaxID=465721 RepID=A0A127F9G5_STEDE|nr:CaiB/BaiF CoA-transferase family protein [Steroidobacter denitrificans]AMN47066.1 carnitine dehydratase [Steroidobacter denitrificans]
MDKPLHGIVVVAVEQAVAAPFCTSRLADAGARVIKIERPGSGDFARAYDTAAGGESSYFVWLNRGKESVVLDLTQQSDRDTLQELIAAADILVQNLKPGAFDRMGLPIEALRARHPRLICCSISGYGDDGPYAHRKAYDLLIQADTGLCSITGGAEGPARVGISIADIATGATAYGAVLERLISRSVTGVGADIKIAMFDVMAEWLTVPLLHADSGCHPQRIGLAHPSIAPYGAFTTKDRHAVLISIQNDREWRVFCERVLERPDLAECEGFATNLERVRRRSDTDTLVAQAFAQRDAAVLMHRLADAELAFAEIHDMHGLARHPHLRRVQIRTATGAVSCPRPAPVVDGETGTLGAVPALGADTATVLASLAERIRAGKQ